MSAVGQRPSSPRFQPPPSERELLANPPAELADGRPRTVSDRLALTWHARQMMRRHVVRAALRVLVLVAGDLAVLLVLRFVLRGIRDVGWFGSAAAAVANQMVPQGALPLVQLLPAVVLGLAVLDNYGSSDRRRDAGRLAAGAAFGLVLPFWGYLWSHPSFLAVPGFVLLAAAISISLLWERQLIDGAVRRFWPNGPGAARALLVGRSEETVRALEHPAISDAREFAVSGMFDPERSRLSGVAGVRDLCQTIKRCRADTLVLAGILDDEAFSVVIDAAGAAGCQILALTRSFSLAGVEPQVVWRRGAPLVALNRPSLRGRQLLLKRTLDLFCAGTGLVLLAPIFLLVAAAVRLTSPGGPIFFRQTRVGLGGRSFTITKFRSMVTDAEAQRDDLTARSLYQDPRLFKMKNDPRVTPVGNFLRRTSLDELPQLWNVFRGDMSLVGPRPPLPSEVDLYEEHHYTRFDVKPGMTGPWQVNGRNKITDFEEVIGLETSYIREWSIWKDLGILLRTVPAVFRMDGAH